MKDSRQGLNSSRDRLDMSFAPSFCVKAPSSLQLKCNEDLSCLSPFLPPPPPLNRMVCPGGRASLSPTQGWAKHGGADAHAQSGLVLVFFPLSGLLDGRTGGRASERGGPQLCRRRRRLPRWVLRAAVRASRVPRLSSPGGAALRPGRTDSPLALSPPLRPGRRRRRRGGGGRVRREQVSRSARGKRFAAAAAGRGLCSSFAGLVAVEGLEGGGGGREPAAKWHTLLPR